jgi:hypothetical protein
MEPEFSIIWRYATGVGEAKDVDIIEKGWFINE